MLSCVLPDLLAGPRSPNITSEKVGSDCLSSCTTAKHPVRRELEKLHGEPEVVWESQHDTANSSEVPTRLGVTVHAVVPKNLAHRPTCHSFSGIPEH